jgi:hypothetical protein
MSLGTTRTGSGSRTPSAGAVMHSSGMLVPQFGQENMIKKEWLQAKVY